MGEQALWSPRVPSQVEVSASLAGLKPARDGEYRLLSSPGMVSVGRRKSDSVQRQSKETWHGGTRGSVQGWSKQSRLNMVKTYSQLDYSPLLLPTAIPAMITLTLPGKAWEIVAPDPQAFKKLVNTFKRRWLDKWGTPIVGLWKMEFMSADGAARSAPHLHCFVTLPQQAGFRGWLSSTWAEVVNHPDPTEREKHERAGTAVDTAKGFRSTDPKRIATYFSKHGLFGAKEYQNTPPAQWTGKSGRYWGYWGLKKATAEVRIHQQESIEVARILRRYLHSQRIRIQIKVWRQKINPETGEITKGRYRRSGIRMGSNRHQGAIGAGYAIVNDAPALAIMVSRYVNSLRN